MLDLRDRDAVNGKLAKLCGYPAAMMDYVSRGDVPDFLRGLRPDWTCDEAEVDGDLLWRMVLAMGSPVTIAKLGKAWVVYCHGIARTHVHPVAALARCAEDAGLLDADVVALRKRAEGGAR